MIETSGIRIGILHSFDDFGQCVASRDSGTPSKKMATKTVPFMNGFYDFSKIYGSLAFESREVKYVFDLIGCDSHDLQMQRSELLDWLSAVHNEDIFDDELHGYHFHGSFSEASWTEAEDGESGQLEVTFLCHPFLIADDYTELHLAVGTHSIVNINQTVNPIAVPDSGSATVKIGEYSQAVTAETKLNIPLVTGENSVQVSGNAITLKWLEERA